jgi:hypothetical protein
VIDVVANGQLRVGGVVAAAGSAGTGGAAGAAGSPGDPGRPGTAGQAGGPGATSDLAGATATGGRGGDGGNGGTGGAGGSGGSGGVGSAGGGGAGGSVRFLATRVDASGGTVDVAGGGNGQAGRFLVAAEIGRDTAQGLATRTETYNGPRGSNPFAAANSRTGAPEQTPYVIDTRDGPERYGLLDQRSDALPFASIAADAPARSIAALARITDEASVLGVSYEGFDLVVYLNLTGAAITDPGFSVAQQTAVAARAAPSTSVIGGIGGGTLPPDGLPGDAVWLQTIQLLRMQGWSRDVEFGGDGPEFLAALQARGVFATLVQSDTTLTALMQGSGLVVQGDLGAGDGALYLQAPVPEPGTWALMLGGGGGHRVGSAASAADDHSVRSMTAIDPGRADSTTRPGGVPHQSSPGTNR